MSKQETPQRSAGFFESLLTVAGAITGAVFGYDNGEWPGLFAGAIVLGGIGMWVGRTADFIIKVALLIIILLLNAAIRRFIWEFISNMLG